MKIKIGDHVRFLNDTGEGKVVRLMPDKIVEVRTSDGWDIPYPINELIVMPDEEGGEAYKPEPVEEKPSAKNLSSTLVKGEKISPATEVFLLIVQLKENNQFSGVRIFLVNDSQQNMSFVYYHVGIDTIGIEEQDLLEPGTKIILDELDLESLSDKKGWQVQGVLFNKKQDFISPMINSFIPFQTKKFASSGAYSENDFLHDPAMLIPLVPEENELLEKALDSTDIRKVLLQKEQGNIKLNTPNVFQSSRKDRPPREIDLHVNQLVDNVIGLSNREILAIQMEKFHKELNQAISSNESSIVYIHGIGNGTLKKELRKSIDRDYQVCESEDASFKEYGFGATLVRIRQNK